MDDKQLKAEIAQQVIDRRGRIIQMAIFLEKLMEEYIARKFSSERKVQLELIITIVAPINFAAKIEMFKHLVGIHSKQFAEDNGEILSGLQQLRDYRNVFAHWPFDTSKEALEEYRFSKGLTFIRHKHLPEKRRTSTIDVEFHVYKPENFIGIYKAFNEAVQGLGKLTGIDPSN